MKVTFLIPVYNEKTSLEELVNRVIALPLDKQLIIVDDGSTDGSNELLHDLAARHSEIELLVQQKRRQGIGSPSRDPANRR